MGNVPRSSDTLNLDFLNLKPYQLMSCSEPLVNPDPELIRAAKRDYDEAFASGVHAQIVIEHRPMTHGQTRTKHSGNSHEKPCWRQRNPAKLVDPNARLALRLTAIRTELARCRVERTAISTV
jgi:hypothetical protein